MKHLTNNKSCKGEIYFKKTLNPSHKLFAVIFCLVLICALLPVLAFATSSVSADQNAEALQNSQQDETPDGVSVINSMDAMLTDVNATDEYDEVNYLCFTTQSAGSTITLNAVGTPTQGQAFQTSTNKTTWSDYTIGTELTLTNAGDKVYWRAKDGGNTTVSESEHVYFQFSMDASHNGKIDASGSIMTLLDQSDSTRSLANKPYCFYALFYDCTALGTPPTLPATTLSNHCYHRLFYHCPKLASAPTLPATNLADDCYHSMFFMCDAIETAPDLPATTMKSGCYEGMFKRCAGLSSMPLMGYGNPIAFDQPSCCKNMFVDCANLAVFNSGTACMLNCSSVTATHATMAMFLGCSTAGDYCKEKVTTPEGAFKCWSQTVTHDTITFNGNGGTTEAGDSSYIQKAVDGATVSLRANEFSRTNYVFAGWSTSPSASSATYTDEQEITVSNTTLYAVWVQNKQEPEVSDLTFTAPTSLVYDGESKTASFSGQTGMGTITASYSEELEGPWVSQAPTDAGTYYVRANIAEGSGYVAKNLISDDWQFTISKAKYDVPSARTDLVYNGEVQTGVIQLTVVRYTVSDNKATNAGSYTATVSLDDKTNYEWNLETPTSDDQSVAWSIAKRSVTLTSDSASKVFDGLPLSAENVVVSGDGFVASEKSQITYTGFATLTDVGTAQNSFSVNWGSIDKSNYDTTINFGTLEITSSSCPGVEVDTKALKEIQQEYQKKYPGQKIAVKMNVDQDDVSSEDVEKIKTVAGDKKLKSYDATLVVEHDGTPETVSEASVPISIQYKFDFSDKSDVQSFRVHNKGNVEEMTTDTTKTENVVYDKQAGTVKITANKYSTYSIAYNEVVTPTPTPQSDTASATSATGDATTALVFAFGVLSVVCAVSVGFSRRKRDNC